MKLFHAMLPILTALLLSGCIGENKDGCYTENNLILNFRYYGGGQTDIFPENIYKTDVFVFDETNHLVLQQSLSQASLNAFEGTKLSLSPGTYRIVCWGNVMDKAVCEGIGSGSLFADASVCNNSINDNAEAENGDPLYYGTTETTRAQPQVFNVTVPEVGIKNETVLFCCAHTKVEVYVKGINDLSAQGQLLPPIISFTNILSSYDFDMQPLGPVVSFRDTSTFRTMNEEQVAVMEFYTPLIDGNTQTQLLVIKQSDNSVVATIGLADFIAENNITIPASGEMIIPILVEFKQASVEVTLPDWSYNPVNPEF